MVRIIKQPPWIVGINVEFGVVVRENIYYVHFPDVVQTKKPFNSILKNICSI